MPIPITGLTDPDHGNDVPAIQEPVQEDWLRQKENWAIYQQRLFHEQALYQVGEYSFFYLMWSLIDFNAGLVARCTRCWGTNNSRTDRIGDVYNQPSINRCPDCFGTSFEGGYRAKIVRPTIWSDNDETERLDKKGVMHPEAISVESTWDFRMRQGDYILRSDGSRWRAADSPKRVTLRTGFLHPDQKNTSMTYNRIQARHEEPGTVAYILPPVSGSAVHEILNDRSYYPQNFSAVEVIRAPLIPPDVLVD